MSCKTIGLDENSDCPLKVEKGIPLDLPSIPDFLIKMRNELFKEYAHLPRGTVLYHSTDYDSSWLYTEQKSESCDQIKNLNSPKDALGFGQFSLSESYSNSFFRGHGRDRNWKRGIEASYLLEKDLPLLYLSYKSQQTSIIFRITENILRTVGYRQEPSILNGDVDSIISNLRRQRVDMPIDNLSDYILSLQISNFEKLKSIKNIPKSFIVRAYMLGELDRENRMIKDTVSGTQITILCKIFKIPAWGACDYCEVAIDNHMLDGMLSSGKCKKIVKIEGVQ